jgi:hypothetical protein
MGTLIDDVRVGIRRLRQQPGFAAVAILMLGLGLGANITMFTLVHSLLLQTLPVERPQELYRLGDNNDCCVNSGLAGDYSLFSYQLYRHLRDNIPEFSSLAGFRPWRNASASGGTATPWAIRSPRSSSAAITSRRSASVRRRAACSRQTTTSPARRQSSS